MSIPNGSLLFTGFAGALPAVATQPDGTALPDVLPTFAYAGATILPNGTILAGGSALNTAAANTTRLAYPSDLSSPIYTLGNPANDFGFSFGDNRNDAFFTAGTTAGTSTTHLTKWNAADGSLIHEYGTFESANFVDAIAVSPDESFALMFPTGGGGFDVYIWDLNDDSLYGTIVNPGGGNPDGFNAVALADGTFLIPVNKTNDNKVVNYDIDGNVIHTFQIPSPYEDTDFTYITRGYTDDTFWCAVDDDTFTHTVVFEFEIATGNILHQWISPAWSSGGNVYRAAFAVVRGASSGATFDFDCSITIIAPTPIPSAGFQQWRLHSLSVKVRIEQSS